MTSPWTAESIPDQRGRTLVITGANSGLGYEATRMLADRGATVVMACRSVDRGRAAAAEIRSEHGPEGTLDVRELDLGDLESIETFAADFHDAYDELHALCNNAGVMGIPRRETADGFERQFGVNHLGHFALTGRLLETILETDGDRRIVTQSSGMHTVGEIDFEDLHSESSYGKWNAYAQSKLANLLFAYGLDRRLGTAGVDGVASLACHPGYADTNLQSRGAEATGSRIRAAAMRAANAVFAQSAETGALPLAYAATADPIEGGEYVGPGGLFGMRGYPEQQRSSDRSYDPDLAERLWRRSVELTGVEYGLGPA